MIALPEDPTMQTLHLELIDGSVKLVLHKQETLVVTSKVHVHTLSCIAHCWFLAASYKVHTHFRAMYHH